MAQNPISKHTAGTGTNQSDGLLDGDHIISPSLTNIYEGLHGNGVFLYNDTAFGDSKRNEPDTSPGSVVGTGTVNVITVRAVDVVLDGVLYNFADATLTLEAASAQRLNTSVTPVALGSGEECLFIILATSLGIKFVQTGKITTATGAYPSINGANIEEYLQMDLTNQDNFQAIVLATVRATCTDVASGVGDLKLQALSEINDKRVFINASPFYMTPVTDGVNAKVESGGVNNHTSLEQIHGSGEHGSFGGAGVLWLSYNNDTNNTIESHPTGHNLPNLYYSLRDGSSGTRHTHLLGPNRIKNVTGGAATETFTFDGGQVFVCTASGNKNLNPSGTFPEGHTVIVSVPSGSNIVFDSGTLATTLTATESAMFVYGYNGSASVWRRIAATTTVTPSILTGSTNNTVVTVTGANAIQGEANLQFDGSTLAVTGALTTTTTATIGTDLTVTGGDITYGNGQVATLGVTTSGSGTVGRDLTISAGSTTAASGNTDGGDLVLKSGLADGTGSSFIGFHTSTATSDDAVAERMRIHTDGNIGIGTATPSSTLEIQGGLTTAGSVLTMSTKETSVVNNDVLGRINFQAPLDTGADSDLVAASIVAIAQDTFSDTVNSTALVFQTGKSETATTKMTIDEDGAVTLAAIAACGTDTDKFLVSDSGVIKFRTGAEVRSDIGAGTSSVTLSGSTDNTIATVTGANALAGEANLTFDGKSMTVNTDTSGDGAEDLTGLHVDFDRTVAGSGTAAHNDIGINLDVNSASLGTSSVIGMDIDVTGAASGTSTATGLTVDVGSADTNYAALFNGGKVGIGTVIPQTLLEIKNLTEDDGPMLRLSGSGQDGANNLIGGIEAHNADSSGDGPTVVTNIKSFSYQGSGQGGYMTFGTHDGTEGGEGSEPVERMRINGVGKVGIGTTTPSSPLEIQDGLTTTGAVLTLSTKEPSVVANDVLGQINFQAPLDTGADSDLVGASIQALATDTFSDTVNKTDLIFKTGASETATEKARITSAGKLNVAGLTASEILITDANKNLTSAAVATYPSLTELAYVKGATSAIQTQLGTKEQVGKKTMWVPAAAMYANTTNGCSALTQVELSNGPELKCLDFDDGATESAQFTVAFPKSWNEGTVTFKAYWCSTATDTDGVSWGLRACGMNDNETINLAFGTQIVVDDANQGAANELMVTAESSAITIAGTPAAEDLTFFQISRIHDDSNDTAAEDARLLGIKLYYTTDGVNDA